MKPVSIYTTSKFRKAFRTLPRNIQKRAFEKENIFREDPFDRRLRTHKLAGKLKGRCSFSVDRSYRVLFRFKNKTEVIFENIGPHAIYG